MKKYSDKFIHEYSNLKFAKIGIEFEFYMKDLSFYKTMEILNQYLDPVKVHGFRLYHSDFKPDEKNFKIEPDLSGGSNMVELITGPLEYNDAKYYLVKILKFIQNYGYTNEKCSIHFNISFNNDEKDLNDLNVLKLILNTDEDEIYRYYPNRRGNIYSKSIKGIVPYKQYDFFNVSINSVSNNMRLPNDKYYGINFSHITKSKNNQRVEYRYLGGTDYEKNIGNLIYFMDRFVLDLYNSVDVGFNKTDSDNLENYLEENIEKYKSFNKFETFIVEYPKVELQVDQNGTYEVVDAYFNRLYPKLFSLIESIDDLNNCIINYVTKTQTIEIVSATLKSLTSIKNIEFINCVLLDGIYENCTFYACEVNNSQISTSKIANSEVNESKVLSCHVETSGLSGCYFMNGFLNGDMFGGIFRSGELGPFASISPETKIVSKYDNFFDTSFDSECNGDKLKSFKK